MGTPSIAIVSGRLPDAVREPGQAQGQQHRAVTTQSRVVTERGASRAAIIEAARAMNREAELVEQPRPPAPQPRRATSAPRTESAASARARERRRGIAGHEAAHALVGWLVGHDIEEVDVEPGFVDRRRGTAGSTTHRRGQADPFAAVVVSLAGYVFDLLSLGPASDEAVYRAGDVAHDDRTRAREAAARLDPAAPDRILHAAQAVAGELLERHWSAVEVLADELVVARRLDGDRLVVAVEAALDGLDPMTWVIRRRAAADAAGPDPAAWEAAWEAAGPRWHGAATEQTRAVYETTWHAGERRRRDVQPTPPRTEANAMSTANTEQGPEARIARRVQALRSSLAGQVVAIEAFEGFRPDADGFAFAMPVDKSLRHDHPIVLAYRDRFRPMTAREIDRAVTSLQRQLEYAEGL